MSFMIAAAGTGGHVFPGLAVAEALVAAGIERAEIVCVGGDRIESRTYPEHGFPFLELELKGLKRSLHPSNLSLPLLVLRARRRITAEIESRSVRAVIAMGGYVTIPTGMAASKSDASFFVAEQNAGAGLANRIASRWADRVFVSFPNTTGLPMGEWVGNPVRDDIARFDRATLREEALDHYGLKAEIPTLGVFGGSLGARAINVAIASLAAGWQGPPFQMVQLVGRAHENTYADAPAADNVYVARRGFEPRMDLFFAAIDLVVARAGGSVAEITATGTPAILVPGEFGSSGHQGANASFLEQAGAGIVLREEGLPALADLVRQLLFDPIALENMAEAARAIARPDAANLIAGAMIEAAS
ncbi:MAG: UDP-N-acetylglucosamine--N-acetylmuramyl-(pentapeptide) pyrophosphoryl-undecaprenol N-acetylglucosamine transferase [Actinobacteria bacterium]|nr:MAG: UDP-N-acetylglucosamine--N-acetylmuramyl-(pentapeptide) pyrophosphoryl-undecaprenol N-acetylglucosamine transferase [Actinomycetota bacterium]